MSSGGPGFHTGQRGMDLAMSREQGHLSANHCAKNGWATNIHVEEAAI